jgi:hypothetical protein
MSCYDIHAKATGVQRGTLSSTLARRNDDVLDKAATVQRGAISTPARRGDEIHARAVGSQPSALAISSTA